MNTNKKDDMKPENESNGGQRPELATAICSLLDRGGWREYPDQFRKYARCFYKRFDTPTRCRCNDDKPGMQVCVAVSQHDQQCAYEIELAGELSDGTWIKLHNWAMPDRIEDGLATIPRLLDTWEFISANVELTRRMGASPFC
jgi:hypothetical protein